MTRLTTSVSKEQLLACADSLDAATCVMHGSAYQPAHAVVKLLRQLAEHREVDSKEMAAAVRKLIDELRHFANTVARPGSDKMQSAARLLSTILEEQRFN